MRIILLFLFTFFHVTVVPLSPEILERIFIQHQTHLIHANVENSPFIITFSGTPGMGKTVLAKKLENSLHAVRISTDLLREILHTTGQVTLQEYDAALQEYIKCFFQHYTAPNRRIILDASIDRKYPQLFSFLEKYQIPYLTIRLDVPREIVEERLKQREGARATWYLKHLDSWMNDYQQFAEINTNYLLYNNVDDSTYETLNQNIKNILEANYL